MEIQRDATERFLAYRRQHAIKVLFADVSELVQKDIHTGIQRVVRAILKQWTDSPPGGYQVVPIHATRHHGYRICANLVGFGLGHQNLSEFEGATPLVRQADVVYGLDFAPVIVDINREFFTYARLMGARVMFHLHDIICLRKPEFFPVGTAEGFEKWLRIVLSSSGVVCVSKTVLNDLSRWIEENSIELPPGYSMNFSLNGMDVSASLPTSGHSPKANKALIKCAQRVKFLMVGTLEPRKMHLEVIRAFDEIWDKGHTPALFIVGRMGWRCEKLMETIQNHPRLEKDLFWFDDISDEGLCQLYQQSSCLIAASVDEGYGLPLAEAMCHGLPLLVRKIPIFEEICGTRATYFNGENGALPLAIERWIENLYLGKCVPEKAGEPLFWEKSVQKLNGILRLN